MRLGPRLLPTLALPRQALLPTMLSPACHVPSTRTVATPFWPVFPRLPAYAGTRIPRAQTRAAEIIGLPQPKLSAVLRGQFRGVSEEKLMRCLIALGQDVKIAITPSRKGRTGSLSVAA